MLGMVPAYQCHRAPRGGDAPWHAAPAGGLEVPCLLSSKVLGEQKGLGSNCMCWDVPLRVGAPQPLVFAHTWLHTWVWMFSSLGDQVFPVVTVLGGCVSTRVGSLGLPLAPQGVPE